MIDFTTNVTGARPLGHLVAMKIYLTPDGTQT
jgi:hypothetical protein